MTPAETILAEILIVAGLAILAAWIIHGICGAIEFLKGEDKWQ